MEKITALVVHIQTSERASKSESSIVSAEEVGFIFEFRSRTIKLFCIFPQRP